MVNVNCSLRIDLGWIVYPMTKLEFFNHNAKFLNKLLTCI